MTAITKYVLRTWGPAPDVEISAYSFNRIRSAAEYALAFLRVEEQWAIVADNFASLEKAMLNSAVDSMMYNDIDWSRFQDIRVDFARLLQSLLSSCRSYVDHIPQHLQLLNRNGADIPSRFAALRAEAYDRSFGYRFMEQLRNHAQHFGLPVHGTMFDTRVIKQASGDLFRHVAGASIDTAILMQNRKFKRRVLNEAIAVGSHLDVISMTREYIEELNSIHLSVRSLSKENAAYERDVISSEISEWSKDKRNPIGLRAMSLDTENRVTETWTVFLEPFDRIDTLHARNGSLRNLRIRYVSGEFVTRDS